MTSQTAASTLQAGTTTFVDGYDYQPSRTATDSEIQRHFAGGDDAADKDGRWDLRALCTTVDPEAFFPEKGCSSAEAKKVCIACPVRSECLERALGNDERFGVWGGKSERERRAIRKARGLSVPEIDEADDDDADESPEVISA